jgi:hypothetical protein
MVKGGNNWMDVRIEFAGKEIVTVPYDSIPAFFLLLRENGFPFKWDLNNRKIELLQGLDGKNILLLKDPINKHPSIERFNQNLLDGVQIFLKSCGASVFGKENVQNDRIHLRIILATQEDPTIDRAELDVLYDIKVTNQKWRFVLQEECREAGIRFSSNVHSAETESYMKFLIKIPRSEQLKLQNTLTEKFQMIISMGILARLQANYPLFLLSCLPIHKISFLQQPTKNNNMSGSIEERQLEKAVSTISESTISKKGPITAREYLSTLNRQVDIKNFNAEVFFDYQVILDWARNEKILLFGNLFIKNTGGAPLRNPVICFRLTPKGKINFSGQLVPPNVVETIGVLNSEKGWKYMYDDWFQQAEQKGEIWICPINPLEIAPGQSESFQNFRINFVKDEDLKNVKVEGFVFFQEQGLEYRANNSISLSF